MAVHWVGTWKNVGKQTYQSLRVKSKVFCHSTNVSIQPPQCYVHCCGEPGGKSSKEVLIKCQTYRRIYKNVDSSFLTYILGINKYFGCCDHSKKNFLCSDNLLTKQRGIGLSAPGLLNHHPSIYLILQAYRSVNKKNCFQNPREGKTTGTTFCWSESATANSRTIYRHARARENHAKASEAYGKWI